MNYFNDVPIVEYGLSNRAIASNRNIDNQKKFDRNHSFYIKPRNNKFWKIPTLQDDEMIEDEALMSEVKQHNHSIFAKFINPEVIQAFNSILPNFINKYNNDYDLYFGMQFVYAFKQNEILMELVQNIRTATLERSTKNKELHEVLEQHYTKQINYKTLRHKLYEIKDKNVK